MQRIGRRFPPVSEVRRSVARGDGVDPEEAMQYLVDAPFEAVVSRLSSYHQNLGLLTGDATTYNSQRFGFDSSHHQVKQIKKT